MATPPAKLTRQQRRRRRLLRRAARLAVAAIVVIALVLADRAGLFGRRPLDDRARYNGATCRVVRVIDGDTLDVNIPDGRYDHTRIRLWGVDTPETVHPDKPTQHFGPEASAMTRQLALDEHVTLRLEPTGRTRDNKEYNRLLAYVILPDGRMLNRVLIAQGYGYADPRYDHQFAADFAKVQAGARQGRLGLWWAVTNDDLPFYYHNKLELPPPAHESPP